MSESHTHASTNALNGFVGPGASCIKVAPSLWNRSQSQAPHGTLPVQVQTDTMFAQLLLLTSYASFIHFLLKVLPQ